MTHEQSATDLILSFYGDDFTGSTDVMEALSSNGVPTVLFTRIPDAAQLSHFADCRALGIAGISRSQSPAWMTENLPDIFQWLKSKNARHCHYKTCSTFDSAPHQGSIGCALELGRKVFGQVAVPLVVGAPQLRRYTFFGHLFASYCDKVYRIDRHPVMSRHPATPMDEADLLIHLAKQTDLPSICLDGETMAQTSRLGDKIMPPPGGGCILLDVHDDRTQHLAGTLLDRSHPSIGPFVVGSSGVEYALLSAWKQGGAISDPPDIPTVRKLDRIAVVSGSCSPTTERQIKTALESGFDGIPIDYRALASGEGAEKAIKDALADASKSLRAGKSPIIYTARGPESIASAASLSPDAAGRALGRILNDLIEQHALERMIVAGGDTSSQALGEMNIYAFTLRHPIPQTPGSPLCNAFREDGTQLEIALKGGQIGDDSYFVSLRDGKFDS